MGRLDAFNGLLLFGNGKGMINTSTSNQSGFLVGGDAKGLISLTNAQGNPWIMTTQNRGKLKSFSLSKKYSTQSLSTKDAVVIEHLRNGKSRRREINYETSFFS